eukprot:c20312_g1_i1.p1 GENE.c20312_g1_i1~~c20312_g1_i1.p1  ORF type:complete len:435 (+),score=134.89 c20312_g1_i1:61-1365(+)
MISAILFLNEKGDVVISRFYRDDVKRPDVEQFRLSVIQAKSHTTPIRQFGDTHFLYVKHSNIYVVALTSANVNAPLAFQFLSTLIGIFKSYFGVMDEDSIKNNFVLIYELLDETMDHGFPQNCQADVLKLYITQQGVKSDLAKAAEAQPSSITVQATGVNNWRPAGIKYPKNEVYIDVIESVNVLMSQKGTILRNDVTGQIIMKTFLSGMPECKFGLNDKVLLEKEANSAAKPKKDPKTGIEIDDCTFHQCVKLGKFETDRTISFVPPDGEFQLMAYRVTDNVTHPFRVKPIIRELGRTRIEVDIKVKSFFPARLSAQNVTISIPMPKNTALCRITTSSGKAKYKAEAGAIVWKMRRFPGGMEYGLSGEVELMASTSEKTWSRPPISMDFQVPMFTASGLTVRFLKIVEKSRYQTVKWVRYVTKAGTYEFRSTS